MSFREFQTLAASARNKGYDVTPRQLLDLPRDTYEASARVVGPARASIEAIAFADNRTPPVFKVYSNLCRTLMNCEFRLQVKDWQVPFESFIVLVESGTGALTVTPIDARKPLHELSSLLYTQQGGAFSILAQGVTLPGCSLPRKDELPTSMYIGNKSDDNEQIERLVDGATIVTRDGTDPSHGDSSLLSSTTPAWLRIIVGVSLLATSGDKNIEPDILSKDLQRYIEAKRKGDEQRAKALADRCERRRGYKCFAVGRDVTIRELYGHQGDEGCDDSERHLSFQHLRRAHFRKTHSGKVVFIRHTIVRPDLPAANTRIEYQLS